MNVSTFHVDKMDCPTEEQMIRLKLAQLPEVQKIEVDLSKRMVHIFHHGNSERINEEMSSLGLGARYHSTQKASSDLKVFETSNQTTVLKAVLLINSGFFLVEFLAGILSRSMGLMADSLDMLADAIVYGLSLIAVGGSLSTKKKVAGISGYFQAFLAFLGFFEVIRRFIVTIEPPDYRTMLVVSVFALLANIISLILLSRTGREEAHLKASWIFTSNDILANLGVIVASLLVLYTGNNRPDLIIGAIVFGLVLRGAWRILQLSR